MNVVIKTRFQFYIANTVIVCCFISAVRATTVLIERSLLQNYEANGIIKWPWDLELFCKSQTPTDKSQLRLKKACILNGDVKLQKVKAEIRMEVLLCEYAATDENKTDHSWRLKNFYASGVNNEVFLMGAQISPTDRTDSSASWIIREVIRGGERRLRVNRRFMSYPASPSSVVGTEKMLANYYNNYGVLKWIWNGEIVCRLQIPPGFNFQRATLRNRGIRLAWLNSVEIDMEVLVCKYNSAGEVVIYFYANGPNGEIYYVKSAAGEREYGDPAATWTIHYEILGEETSALPDEQLSNVANIFKILSEAGREGVLRKREWPQIFSVDNEPPQSNRGGAYIVVPQNNEQSAALERNQMPESQSRDGGKTPAAKKRTPRKRTPTKKVQFAENPTVLGNH